MSAWAGPRSRGFALLLVLWTMVLLSLLTLQITAGGRAESQIAGNLRRNAAAQAAADGLVQEAVFRLLDRSTAHWQADAQVHVVSLATGSAEVTVQALGGRVNPNLASPALLRAVLVQAGATDDAATGVAAAMVAWRAPPAPGAPPPQVAPGAGYRPPMAPFQSLGELALVAGMTPGLLARLEPMLSLAQPAAKPDPVLASRPVLAALRAANEAGAEAGGAEAGEGGQAPLAVRITCVVRGANEARFIRVADVVVAQGWAGAGAPQQGALPFRIIDWQAPAG